MNPTYHDLGDHSESIQIDFDPSRISYRELLDVFWRSHDPARASWSRQYRATIFYHSEAQGKTAAETKDRIASETGRKVSTAIEPYSGFTLAEDYHQKHSLRFYPEVMREFKAIYPDMKRLLNSTAVARANGYLGGYGSCDSLEKEREGLGLSPKAQATLISVVCGRTASATCPTR